MFHLTVSFLAFFEDSAYYFPEYFHQSAMPPAVFKCACYLTSPRAFIKIHILDNCHSGLSQMKYKHIFDLNFSGKDVKRFFMYLLIIYVSFFDKCLWFFCPYIDWVVCGLLLLRFLSYLHSLVINLLSEKPLENILLCFLSSIHILNHFLCCAEAF